MLGLFLDVLILAAIMYFINREEAGDFGKLALVSIAVGFVNLVLALCLAGTLGFLVLLPIVAVDAAIIKYAFGLTWLGGGVTIGLFAVCKVAQVIAFSVLFSA